MSLTSAAAADEEARFAVISPYQKQPRIYARAVSGWFAAWRWTRTEDAALAAPRTQIEKSIFMVPR